MLTPAHVLQVPYGYSDTIAGLMGATLLIAGIVAACVTAPLFDRVFARRLSVVGKLITSALAALWLSLIWAGESALARAGSPSFPSPSSSGAK